MFGYRYAKLHKGIYVKTTCSANRDYKLHPCKPTQTGKYHQFVVLAAAVVTLSIIISIIPDAAEATRTQSDSANQIATANPVPLQLPQNDTASSATAPQIIEPTDENWRTITVKKGENLSTIFKDNGLSATQLYNVLAIGGETKALKRLYPGDTLKLNIDDNNQLLGLVYDIDETHILNVSYHNDGFAKSITERQLEKRTTNASATIDSSLYLAAQKAGLSDNLTMELANIFGWDIDFALDIREDDNFTIIYEEVYIDGKKARDGNIVAAEFSNRGKTYRALRYTNEQGHTEYYAPDGKSMRKAFLRSPVEFSRISSRFSTNRKHPVLNRIRAHKGVDYAAPRGTPIKSTGDGKIIHIGNKGGYGKTIILRHGTQYSTLYAHMSGFKRGLHVGSRVKQGQTIGYVGSTGLATGPHLHYEFRLNGVHRNPLTVKLPDATSLPEKYKDDFAAKSKVFLAQLDLLKRTNVALNTTE